MFSESRSRVIVAAAIAAGMWLSCGPVSAADSDRVEIFGGGETGFYNEFFMGALVPVPGASVGNGFALRLYLDGGGYEYEAGRFGNVRANFAGAQLDGVYQFTGKNLWNNVALGINDTYTALNPHDANNPERGQQVELRAALDGGAAGGPWRADWYGYYGARIEDYQYAVDATHSIAPKWRLGGEYYGEGSPSYTMREAGPFVAVGFSPRSEFQLSAGPAWQTGFASRTFVRALYYGRF